MDTIRINSTNYSGQTADITFSPATGGTQVISGITIPYDFTSNFVYGDYSVYFTSYDKTCPLNVPVPAFPTWSGTTNEGTQFMNAYYVETLLNTFDETSISTITTTNSNTSLAFIGSIVAPNEKIYFIPYRNRYVGVVDTTTDTYSEITTADFGDGGDKWASGILAQNGYIYGIPTDAGNFLKIDPVANTATTFGSYSFNNAFAEAVLADNGNIYCVPRDQNLIYVIETQNNDNVYIINPGLSGTNKFWSGCLAPNGKVYMVGRNESRCLVLDPADDSITYINSTPTGSFTSFLAPDGKIYVTGNAAGTTYYIDPNTDTFTTITTGRTTTTIGRQSNITPDGRILGISNVSGEGTIILDPSVPSWADQGTFLTSNNQSWGLALAKNGKIYAAPAASTTCVVIGDEIVGGLPDDFVLSRYVNKK